MGQGVENPDARGVAKEFEDLGQGIDGFPRQQPRLHVGERGRVGWMRLRTDVRVEALCTRGSFGDGHDY